MRNFRQITLLLIALFAFNFGFSQHIHNAECSCSKTKIKLMKDMKLINSERYTQDDAFAYDLKYHRLEIFFDDMNTRYIRGGITSYFLTKISNFNQIKFDLADNMTIDSIYFHENKILPANYTLSDNTLSINLGTIINNTLDSISVYYQGVPPNPDGFGSFAQETHDGSPIIWTLSEPYGAKDWWPCKQSLNDKIDSIDVIVTQPEGFFTASNGLLISETTTAGKTASHWKHVHPIPAYLIAVAVANYSKYSNNVTLTTGQNVEVLNYVYPEDLTSAQAQTPDVLDVIQLYSDLFIPYPYHDEKYGHAQFGWGGGMEHTTMSFMGGFGHHLMAHELAHQWFGDYVTCGSWRDIWLNESFATYLDALTVENGLDDGSYYSSFKNWKEYTSSYARQYPDGSVWVDDTTSVGRIFSSRLSYRKGAMVLHMLRKKIGDDAFFGGLRNYLEDPQIANAYARTSDLKQHLETSSGEDLTEFLDDWFYGEGYPTYTIDYSNISGNSYSVTISQTQSDASVSFFEMGVPVKFIGIGKDSTIIFDNTTNAQNFVIDLDFEVLSVVFDPESDLIAGTPTITTSVEELNKNSEIKIQENPVSDKLTILNFSKNNISEISIYNYSGKLVSTSSNNNKNKIIIDVNNLSKGVYFVKLKTNSKYRSLKFVKI